MTNALSTFAMFMNQLFKRHIGKYALIYLDDIIIYSPSFEQHLKDVASVLSTLRDKYLLAKPAKCEFFKQEVKFLENVVSKNGILPNPDKAKAVVDMPPPCN